MSIIEATALFKDEEQCSSSSIGKNSDVSSETESGDMENEAQSSYKFNGPLDMMDSLQQVLPIRRGISKFYDGKSKSFTSLVETISSSSSLKDIGKPDNAYTRRRRNLMAVNHVWEKNRSFPSCGGISKRTMSASRSALALAFAINYDDSSSSCTSEESNPVSPPPPLPPLYPRSNVSSAGSGLSSPMIHQNFSGWRSFSLVDLQNCATAATLKMQSSSMRNKAAHLS